MEISKAWMAAAILATATGGASCSAATAGSGVGVVQPGAPGEETRELTGAEVAAVGEHPHTEADVRFMQGMIAHHAQALRMTGLVAGRTESEDIRLLALRIDISQEDEIALMRRWLEERGEVAPDPAAAHEHAPGAGDAPLMPGMLTEAELAGLAAARGEAFDRLFLAYMIRHHQGALAMVRELFASEGSGQETEIWQFASHVEGDQQVEIDRMSRMLSALR